MGNKVRHEKPAYRKAVDIACVIHDMTFGEFCRSINYSFSHVATVLSGDRVCDAVMIASQKFVAAAGLSLREEIMPLFEEAVKTQGTRAPRVKRVKFEEKEKAA